MAFLLGQYEELPTLYAILMHVYRSAWNFHELCSFKDNGIYIVDEEIVVILIGS